MDSSAFARQISARKSEIERELGIARYPYQTLDNLSLLEKLFAAANLEPAQILGPGKILDVGCGDGDLGLYFSSLNHAVDFIDFEETNQNQMRMVRALAQRLPGKHTVQNIDIDRGLGPIDSTYSLAIAFGLLYHLKNPFLMLGDLATRASFAVVSTRIVDAAMLPESLASAYLVSDHELGQDNTNYWLFNSAGFARLAERSGWTVLSRIRFGNLHTGDASTQDAREGLLLASRYSVFGEARLTHGLHRVEFESFRWTYPQFGIEVRRSSPAQKHLRMAYYLPSPWVEEHRLRAFHNQQELIIQLIRGADECVAILNLPDLPGPVLIDIHCEHATAAQSDERPLGVVLRLNSQLTPLRLY